MIGGGPGAFIGSIHRLASTMDGEIELVAGAFSSDPSKSKQTGEHLHLSPERIYESFEDMLEKESQMPPGVRIDLVSIVTPNYLHFKPAKLALEKGFHVVLDKPMTLNLEEAKALKLAAKSAGKYFCLTHTYTGYPMVKEARQQVLSGNLGKIRKVVSTYPQGWLSTFVEGTDNKQAAWRADPAKTGIANCMGDIGTHAFNLAEYVSGLKVLALCADINTMVRGRALDDDGAAFLKFDSGASGLLYASQIMAGEENDISIKVYGEKGGLEWKQSDCNSLVMKWLDKPSQVLRAGSSYLSSFAKHNTRTPPGHPEGYLEAFANHYRNFALCVKAQMDDVISKEEWLDFPGIEEGVRGMAFIENAILSGKSNNKWINFNV